MNYEGLVGRRVVYRDRTDDRDLRGTIRWVSSRHPDMLVEPDGNLFITTELLLLGHDKLRLEPIGQGNDSHAKPPRSVPHTAPDPQQS